MLSAVYFASISTSCATFVFFYSFLFPLGIGLCYWPPIICSWEWFPQRKGLMTGLFVGAFGFGAFFFGFLARAIANPDNLKLPNDGPPPHFYPVEVAERVPLMFNRLLLIWSIMSMLSILLVSRNPQALITEEN